jgi:hypothetical protein
MDIQKSHAHRGRTVGKMTTRMKSSAGAAAQRNDLATAKRLLERCAAQHPRMSDAALRELFWETINRRRDRERLLTAILKDGMIQMLIEEENRWSEATARALVH